MNPAKKPAPIVQILIFFILIPLENANILLHPIPGGLSGKCLPAGRTDRHGQARKLLPILHECRLFTIILRF